MNSLIVGTRGSKLAIKQTQLFMETVGRHAPLIKTELKIIKTRGDDPSTRATASGRAPLLRVVLSERSESKDDAREKPSRGVSEKSLFTKELEDELIQGSIDAAVHSGKDLASRTPPGLAVGAVLRRGDRSDAFCSKKFDRFDSLPKGAVVGTSSIRRQAQILLRRPDLQIKPLRGNVDTRLKKLAQGECDALVLASCGLERLGLEGEIKERFTPKSFLPAPAQGAIVVQFRSDRSDVRELLKSVSDEESFSEVKAERALLERLEAGCWVPLGASATVSRDQLTLIAGLFSADGKQSVIRRLEGSSRDPVSLGWQMASVLLRGGGQEILDRLRNLHEKTVVRIEFDER